MSCQLKSAAMGSCKLAFGITSLAILALFLGVNSASADLVAHYPFDGNANDVVTGGAANNGIEHGGVGYSGGRFGSALNLDGVDDYVEIPDGGGAEVGAADYTIAFWVKSTDDNGHFVKTGTGGAPGNGIRAMDAGNFGVYGENLNGAFQVDDAASGPNLILPDPAATVDGTWHHYALVRDAVNEQVSVYQDGALAPAGPRGSGNPFAFGSADVTSPGEIGVVGVEMGGDQTPNLGGALEGMIDDLRFYDNALTQAGVQALVPEPSALVLLALGCLGCALRARRR